MSKYVLIAATLLLTTAGQLLIKWRALSLSHMAGSSKLTYLTAMFLDPVVWCGLVAAVVASVCWMLAVQQAALSVAYPFMALSFLLVPAAASVLFHEQISSGQYLGLLMIVSGVALTAILQ